MFNYFFDFHKFHGQISSRLMNYHLSIFLIIIFFFYFCKQKQPNENHPFYYRR